MQRGQVLSHPGGATPHRTFRAEVYVLTKDEGGRHTPFFANYRPQFYFRTADVTGTVQLGNGAEMVMPGDSAEFTIELNKPIALEARSRFAIREGNRTVGAGVVTEIVEVTDGGLVRAGPPFTFDACAPWTQWPARREAHQILPLLQDVEYLNAGPFLS